LLSSSTQHFLFHTIEIHFLAGLEFDLFVVLSVLNGSGPVTEQSSYLISILFNKNGKKRWERKKILAVLFSAKDLIQMGLLVQIC